MDAQINIKQQAVSGTRWNIIVTAVRIIVQLSSLTVLARLLSPEDFGLMNMVMVVVGFGQLFSDFGFSSAVIYKDGITRLQLSTLYWVTLLIGIILFGFTWAATPLIVLYYQESALIPIIKWASTIFIIVPLGQLFDSLLRKELLFGIQARIVIAGQAAYLISSIILALLNFGVMSLIWGTIARSSLTTILLVFTAIKKDWMPTLRIKLSGIKDLFGFGSFQVGDRLISYLSNNIDYMLIGRFLGTEALGFYNLAYNFVRLPTSLFNPIIVTTLFPSFSKIKTDNRRIRRIYQKALTYIGIMVFPIMVGIALTAPQAIRLVYGAQWIPSIPIVRIFAIVAIFRSLGNPMGALLLSKGKPNVSFYINVGSVLLMATANIIGVKWGIWGVAISVFIVTLLKSPLTVYIPYFLTGFNLRNYWNAVKVPLFSTMVMSSVYLIITQIWFQTPVLDLENLSRYSELLITIPISILSYFFVLWLLDKKILAEVYSLLIPGKKKAQNKCS